MPLGAHCYEESPGAFFDPVSAAAGALFGGATGAKDGEDPKRFAANVKSTARTFKKSAQSASSAAGRAARSVKKKLTAAKKPAKQTTKQSAKRARKG